MCSLRDYKGFWKPLCSAATPDLLPASGYETTRFYSTYAAANNTLINHLFQPFYTAKTTGANLPAIEDALPIGTSPLASVALASWSLMTTLGLNYWSIDCNGLEPQQHTYRFIPGCHWGKEYLSYAYPFLGWTFISTAVVSAIVSRSRLSTRMNHPVVHMSLIGVMMVIWRLFAERPYEDHKTRTNICWMISCVVNGALWAPRKDVHGYLLLAAYALTIAGSFAAYGWINPKTFDDYYYAKEYVWVIAGGLTASSFLEAHFSSPVTTLEYAISITALIGEALCMHLMQLWYLSQFKLRCYIPNDCSDLFDPVMDSQGLYMKGMAHINFYYRLLRLIFGKY
ncbi:hypothetical protein CHUAL_012423 [Chamberlinius hualienensis]